MNKYRVSATRFTCGMFKRTGRKKQSRLGCEGHSLDEGHSQGATPASCSGCQVEPASRVRRTFSGTGRGLHEERSSPSLPPLLGHGSRLLGAGPRSRGPAPRPRLSVGHLMTLAAPLWVLTATPELQPSYRRPSLCPFPLLCIAIRVRKP